MYSVGMRIKVLSGAYNGLEGVIEIVHPYDATIPVLPSCHIELGVRFDAYKDHHGLAWLCADCFGEDIEILAVPA